MELRELQRLVEGGESETVEFKKSTAQLPRAGETLCGFLNHKGGQVLIGTSPGGAIDGQKFGDKTQQEIARMLERFEPPAPVEAFTMGLPGNQRSVVVLQAGKTDGIPFSYDGRPYQRVGSTTSRMPQDRYEALLLERAHARRRWKNQPAVGVRLDDLDHEEILRTRHTAIQHRRISAGTSTDVGVSFRAQIGPGARLEDQVGTKSALSRHQVQLLAASEEPQPISALQKLCGRADRTKFRGQVVRPLLEAGLLEMTVPDKPRSSRQEYRTTEAGRRILQAGSRLGGAKVAQPPGERRRIQPPPPRGGRHQ